MLKEIFTPASRLISRICVLLPRYRTCHLFVIVRACTKRPTSVTWQGVGIACYRLGELSEAEDALAEANIYNSKDAKVTVVLVCCLYVLDRVLVSLALINIALHIILPSITRFGHTLRWCVRSSADGLSASKPLVLLSSASCKIVRF